MLPESALAEAAVTAAGAAVTEVLAAQKQSKAKILRVAWQPQGLQHWLERCHALRAGSSRCQWVVFFVFFCYIIVLFLGIWIRGKCMIIHFSSFFFLGKDRLFPEFGGTFGSNFHMERFSDRARLLILNVPPTLFSISKAIECVSCLTWKWRVFTLILTLDPTVSKRSKHKFAETLQIWDICKQSWKFVTDFRSTLLMQLLPLPIWSVWKLLGKFRRCCRSFTCEAWVCTISGIKTNFHKEQKQSGHTVTKAVRIKKIVVQMTSGKASSIISNIIQHHPISSCFLQLHPNGFRTSRDQLHGNQRLNDSATTQGGSDVVH